MRRLLMLLCLLIAQVFWCSAQEPLAILYPDGKELRDCASRLEKLLTSQNFPVQDLSPQQRKNFWEMRDNRQKFGQWLMAAGVHWVVELETLHENDGKLYNLAGRMFARFDPGDGHELVQKLQQASQRWRAEPEYFLCFRHCDNGRIRQALNNLKQQGTILWDRAPWEVDGRLQVDCAYPHQRDFVLVIEEAAGLGWLTGKEQYGQVVIFYGPGWLFWLMILAVLFLLPVGGWWAWKYWQCWRRRQRLAKVDSSHQHLQLLSIPDNICPQCGKTVGEADWLAGTAVLVKGGFYCWHCLLAQPVSDSTIESLRLLSPLGENVFGQYFLAAGGDGKPQVLHCLPDNKPGLKSNQAWPDMLDRFRRVRQGVEKILHKHVVIPGALLAGNYCDATGSKPCFYYTLPYYPVLTLKQVLEMSGDRRLPWPQVQAILYWLAVVLENLHARNLVHRDVKPAHILCDVRGRLWLSGLSLLKQVTGGSSASHADETAFGDLSFACWSDTEPEQQQAQLTRSGRCLGTPAYLAPEQLYDAVSATGKADVWSWGVIAVELCTGENYATLLEGIAIHDAKTCRRTLEFVDKWGRRRYTYDDLQTKLANKHLAESVPDAMWQILRQVFLLEPKRRLSSANLVQELKRAWKS
jgi:serine/threonine protein kinase